MRSTPWPAATKRAHRPSQAERVPSGQADFEDLAAELSALEVERDEAVTALAEVEETTGENEAALATAERDLASAQDEAEELGDQLDEHTELEALRDELAEWEADLEARAEVVGTAEDVAETREEAESDDPTVGSTITFDDWEITLAEVRQHSTLRNSSPRGTYLVLVLDVTNHASSERDLLGGHRSGFNFVDVPHEREYTFDTRASLEASRELNTDAWYLEDIGPGLSGRVPVAIDITEDATWGMAAMVNDGNVSDPFYIDLEES